MCSRCLSLLAALASSVFAADPTVLRVCADPNNMPFSNQRGEGLENRLAVLMARELGLKLEYTWWSQRRSFLKNTVGAGLCDAWMGVPSVLDSVTVTRPYYRSTYVFVTRRDRNLQLISLGDPRLASWRIGIHMAGDDYAPPSVALGRRGLAANVQGFSLFGAYGEENPPARLMRAVAAGEVDVAIVWGPLAGFFARHEANPLEIVPVSPSMFMTVPFTFDISMAVRKGDEALRSKLEEALERNCPAVRRILDEYSVPQVGREEDKIACGSQRQSPLSSSH